MKRETVTILALCLITVSGSFVCGEETLSIPTDPDKAYHFFVGVNLRIPYEETYFPIERIWNARAHIKVDDEIVVQQVSHIKDLRVDRQAKISPQFVRIDDLKCVPEYSPSRNPLAIAARNQAMAQSMASMAQQEMNEALGDSVSGAGLTSASGVAGMGPESSALGQDAELEALGDAEQSYSSMAADPANPQLNRPSWDLLHVSFSISSESYFPSGHLVMIFELTDTPEGEPVMSWFHFLSLNEISPKVETYDYRLTAYPDGMYIVSQEAFLFVNGSEIATNLSAKHVEMTEHDARVFLKYRYLADNNGQTRPPDRSWKYLSPHLRDRIKPDLRNETLTLKIDPEGVVRDVITSRELRAALRPEGISEIASLIYLPALENGQPVAGELTLSLQDVILD